MASDPPVLDGRDRPELVADARARAAAYTDRWDPESDDVGSVLVELFGDMARDVVERLDRVPAKQRVAFYDRLGFAPAAPQPARLPLVFTVAEGATENVAIPAGTQAVATVDATPPERTFEVTRGSGFEATPARLTRLYSVDGAADRLFDHRSGLETGAAATLFAGEDRQRHTLYIAHATLLQLEAGSRFRVTVETGASRDRLADGLVWEYYGTGSRDGEETEEWHPLYAETIEEVEPQPGGGRTVGVTLTMPDAGETVETTVDGTESRWIRARANPNVDPATVTTFSFGAVHVAVGSLATSRGSGAYATELLANDVPLGVRFSEADPLEPFGEIPRPQDTFYVAAPEAFSTVGAIVELSFSAVADGDVGDPDLSWEYWDGARWARLALLEDDTDHLRRSGVVRFRVPADLAVTTVSGSESHWVRVRLVGGDYGTVSFSESTGAEKTWSVDPSGVVQPAFSGLRVRYGLLGPPESLLTENGGAYGPDLAESMYDGLAPFTRLPDAGQAVYFGFDGPLEDGPLTLLFLLEAAAYREKFSPRLRWESLVPGTDRWERVPVTDGTEGLTQTGIVELTLVEATVASERFGETAHWVRARVGETGDSFVPDPPQERAGDARLPGLRIESVDAPGEVVTLLNGGAAAVDLTGYRLDFEYANPHATQVRAFPGGTVLGAGERLAVGTGERTTETVALRFDFEQYVLNNDEPDTVAVLTPAGDDLVTSFEDTLGVESSARVGTGGGGEAGDEGGDDGAGDCTLEPCGTAVETAPTTASPVETPPVVRSLHQNATWASDVRTATDELLGSSDGTRAQRFEVASPPVLDIDVWVDELAALSEAARETLAAESPEDVAPETDAGGSLRSFWVRWSRVDDLLSAAGDERVYALDPVEGAVTFGDGEHGRVPPTGRDSVRATYRTGGGTVGNVAAGAVDELKSALPLVEAVTNPVAGDGGTDQESTAAVLERAPRKLRDRNRAVCVPDVERLALAASRRLVRVRCLPGLDAGGRYAPGWVTVLVVPDATVVRPTPSSELVRQVESSLATHAPATLVEQEPSRLVVRGPSYVAVSVDATLVPTADVESTSTLEETAVGAVVDYLHPLTGGDGNGWGFGELPCLADVFGLLEGVVGVDHVDSLAVTITGSGAPVVLREGVEPPTVSADALVSSGQHDVIVGGA